ncbi:MAG TPA: UDP-N-acetylenolpyruvoylglucosamine reductase, partial [Blastocatellia bacterium]|nr:UDP-N-acetylenolpyruvoylglucosamine reductase [Blastocatellia bacterium]
IVSVTYRLIRDRAPSIRYPELRRLLRERGLTNPTLEDVRRTVIELRKGKGMIIDPSDADSRSAGSFFVNPTVTEEELEAIKALALARRISTSDLPVFPAPDGRLKIPAAWLIERSGFARGYRHGNAGLSAKHVLAIVNLGGATAREVDELASEIRLRVKESFGVELTPEPVFVGFDQPAYG